MMARARSIPGIGLSLLLAVSVISCSRQNGALAADRNVPLASVKQSDFQVEVNTTGELRATRTATALAPSVAGDTLQIIRLTKSGTLAKAGDIIVAFDPSEQEFKLAQSRSNSEEAEQEIVKAKANAAVQVAQDQTALLKAKFAIRQAELDVSKNEIVSVIDGKKNLLTLQEAKRALAQLEQDIQSHAYSNEATIEVAEEKRNKARLEMAQAEKNIENMQVRSSIDGIVIVRANQDSNGGLFFGGMTLPPYQEGDQVNPGRVVAEVIDVDQMEVSAKVKESDRASIKNGQAIDVRVDALPGEVFHARVKAVAGSVSNMWFDDPSHNFDVSAELDHPDGRLKPGFAAHIVVFGDHLDHALSIPRQAIFDLQSKPKVFVETASGFEPQEIKIRYLTDGLAVIDGLKEGTQVALVNPEEKTNGSLQPSPGLVPPIGAATR